MCAAIGLPISFTVNTQNLVKMCLGLPFMSQAKTPWATMQVQQRKGVTSVGISKLKDHGSGSDNVRGMVKFHASGR
jgi:hypothetical protein